MGRFTTWRWSRPWILYSNSSHHSCLVGKIVHVGDIRPKMGPNESSEDLLWFGKLRKEGFRIFFQSNVFEARWSVPGPRQRLNPMANLGLNHQEINGTSRNVRILDRDRPFFIGYLVHNLGPYLSLLFSSPFSLKQWIRVAVQRSIRPLVS